VVINAGRVTSAPLEHPVRLRAPRYCDTLSFALNFGLKCLFELREFDAIIQGMYCAGFGLSAPTANCSAGFYCTLRAVTASPLDGVTGNRCPAGHFCVAGSAVPTPCGLGTFTGSTGNTISSACAACTAGSYCNNTALTAPVGPCPAGYVCTAGTSIPSGKLLHCT